MNIDDLPRPVRTELRGLPDRLAEIVGAHLVAAGLLLDEDPTLAHAHAEAARRRAPRLPVVREAAAETAYAAGDWTAALNDYRAVRRMTGEDDVLPIMADCERALGRPEAALKLAREAERLNLTVAARVEMRIVEAGAREDRGQVAEALRLLRAAVDQFVDAPGEVQARLRFAYAEALLRHDQAAAARRWLESAVELDPDDASGAGERLSELDGMVVEYDDAPEVDEAVDGESDRDGDEDIPSESELVGEEDIPSDQETRATDRADAVAEDPTEARKAADEAADEGADPAGTDAGSGEADGGADR